MIMIIIIIMIIVTITIILTIKCFQLMMSKAHAGQVLSPEQSVLCRPD